MKTDVREIGNYYEPYRRAQRERDMALETATKHRQERRRFEQLVDEGKAIKIVTEDKKMHCTRTHYELIHD